MRSVGWIILKDDGKPHRPLVGPSYHKQPGPSKLYRTQGIAQAYSQGKGRAVEVFIKDEEDRPHQAHQR